MEDFAIYFYKNLKQSLYESLNAPLLSALNENSYIVADTHFGDEKYAYARNKKNMIQQWNKKIKYNDVVLIVGDFGNDISAIHELNGKKILLTSDDDEKVVENPKGWDLVLTKLLIDLEDYKTPHKIEALNFYNIGAIISDKIVRGKRTLITHFPPFTKVDYFSKLSTKLMVKYKCNLCIHGHTHEVNIRSRDPKIKLINISLDKLMDSSPHKISEIT